MNSKTKDELLTLLAKNRIGEYEITSVYEEKLKVEAKDGSCKNFNKASTGGISLRIIKNKRTGFSFTFLINRTSLEKLVEKAIESSVYSDEERSFSFFDKKSRYPEVNCFDIKVETMNEKEKIETAISLESSAKKTSKKITTTRSAQYNEQIITSSFINSYGIELSAKASHTAISLLAVASDGTESESAWDYSYSSFYNQLNPEALGRSAAEKAIAKLNGKHPSGYKGMVLIQNEALAELVELFSKSFLSESIQKGKSRLAGKQGKKIFSDKITIIDSGLDTFSNMAFPFDAEGVPKQKTVLVEKGVLKNFLYDILRGKKDKVRSTGNAVKTGVSSPPLLAPNSFYIEKGEIDRGKLINLLNKGIVITEVMGVHTVNPVTLDVSVGASGFYVKNGKIDHPVRGFALSGNLFEMFNEIEAVGNDLKFIGNFGAPAVLFRNITISS